MNEGWFKEPLVPAISKRPERGATLCRYSIVVVLLLAKQTARVRIPLFAPTEIFKEEKTMDTFMRTYEQRKLVLENRINLLTERGENTPIVNKLQRELRRLEAEYAARQNAAE